MRTNSWELKSLKTLEVSWCELSVHHTVKTFLLGVSLSRSAICESGPVAG